MIRVVIADDQQLVRSGLKMILSTEPGIEVVGEAGTGRAVLAVVGSTRPDVVIMDVRMPEMDGIAATRELATMPGAPKILVLTTFDVDDVVYDALCAGASGFLLKDAPEERLVQAIRIIAEGNSAPPPSRHPATDRGVHPPDADRRRPTRSGPHRARARRVETAGQGSEQRRDRRGPLHHREHGQVARGTDPAQARGP